MTKEHNGNETLRQQKAKEILERVQSENHAPKSTPPTLKELEEYYTAVIDFQLCVLAPKTFENIKSRNKPKVPENGSKKKLLDIASEDEHDLNKLSKSTISKRPVLHHKILDTQHRDEYPPKNGWGPNHDMTREEFAKHFIELARFWQNLNEEERINYLLENAQKLDKSSAWKYKR